jgi:C1A family cysteine protease
LLPPPGEVYHESNGFVGHITNADDSFDAREKWGNLILPVRHQGQCGSCWAFAVTQAAGDRIGIEGLQSAFYSPQDLISCHKKTGGVCVLIFNLIL